jgi:nucleoside-diphosphate-sugar epimerase
VREIGRVAGWNGKIVLVPDDQLPEHLKANYDWSSDLVTNTGRIRRELGYDEIISRDEALIKTVAWERDNSPPEIDTSKFDYEAEDRALEED